MKIIYILPTFILSCLLVTPVLAQAEESASIEKAAGEDLSVAMGHYARSRALLISAIGEFDKGAKLADPKIILDGKRWRGSLVERAQELERLLDPQPRVSKRGAKYEAQKSLLNEAKR
jgi:hypothetical protein